MAIHLSPHKAGRLIRLFVLLFFTCSTLTTFGQCDYQKGASPMFTIEGNKIADNYSTVVIATDESGVIRYLSNPGQTRLSNIEVGKYNVYSFIYRDTAPTLLRVGEQLSDLLGQEGCIGISAPIQIGVCDCTDELPVSGELQFNFTHSGYNNSANYTTQYLAVGSDGNIQNISSTPSFTFTELENYSIYSVNYRNSSGINSLAIGNALTALSGECFQLSNPLGISVCPSGSLPVKMISFEAVENEGISYLTWTTTEEVNSDFYEVQRSSDAKDWRKIGSVKAATTSKAVIDYNFTDQAPMDGINYYRLKTVDLDNTFALSKITSVYHNESNSVLYPNPVKEILFVKNANQVQQIRINNLAGEEVYRSNVLKDNKIDISSFNPGVYVVTITRKDGSTFTKKIIHL